MFNLTRVVVVMVLSCSPVWSHSGQLKGALPDGGDWMHIDGSKNPELIPQWSVWTTALRNLHLVGELPIQVAPYVSDDEAAAILAAAAEQRKNTLECEASGRKLFEIPKHQIDILNEKTEALNLECRARTLRLRDRLIRTLQLPGQTALLQWVESLKAGIQVSVPKKQLAFYLKPE